VTAGRFLPVWILCAGAISSLEGIGPARAAAPRQAAPAAATDDNQPRAAARLNWKTPGADPTKAAIEVIGADPTDLRALALPEMTVDRWTSILPVRVVRTGETRTEAQPPLWGSYRLAGDIITFHPRFPLEAGMTYRAEFNPVRLHEIARTLTPPATVVGEPRDTNCLFAEYSPPKKPARITTQVAAIYPTGDRLPENLLRFYISFTAPMSRGEAYRRITLVDTATAKPVDSAFLELDEELWSPDGTRFTLIFDPGRVKRGLRPREELGPVLEAGKSYSLVIDRGWLDAAGNPLKVGYQKNFRVGQPDESSPDLKTWTIQAPRSNSRDPLEVRFPKALDRALLDRLIWVQNAEAKKVPGQVTVSESECRWQFVPVSEWREGDHRLVVGTELEDVAGNSVASPFEVDVAGPISGRVTAKTLELPFRIGPVRH
jgi:hypothetical protein